MKSGNKMTISKSHYHRNRLLRDRIRRGDSQTKSNASATSQRSDTPPDDLDLPDYFRDAANPSYEDAPAPIVILWDEVA
ncbi:hypothetical protein GCM10011348_16060 [Marinobacterium nitratireducens]|uniref:Uncharacterized protein n=1 Tax=Marinobacterium nitratireducens TaxID=518897 RepID=A0A917ZB72_9GAMM|nr:hypothetical protein [Marinobacterium nitratireducens]GGO80105.1 hypothetical protein GCM10011348_16060 [Marinobacterium nitratireducens]